MWVGDRGCCVKYEKCNYKSDIITEIHTRPTQRFFLFLLSFQVRDDCGILTYTCKIRIGLFRVLAGTGRGKINRQRV